MRRKIDIPGEQRIGTTESGEIAFNLEAFDRLYKGNIIITKRLTDKLIEKLIEHKDKIILHITCTGFGHSRIEPFVPYAEKTLVKAYNLIEKGFPKDHIVLRIDPIVPTFRGIETAKTVLRLFKPLEIKRVRISFLDNYKHVVERFNEARIERLYNGEFHAPIEDRRNAFSEIADCARANGFEIVETCGEPGFPSTPCLSQKDIDILGLSEEIKLEGSAMQRKNCGCPANKTELLKVRPHRCENNCLYCYWKDGDKTNIE